MASSVIKGARIAGLASAVPERVRTASDFAAAFGEDDVRKVCENTGVSQIHVAEASMCTSDLCFAAAKCLLEQMKWDPDSVDAVIFVSQTPDYLLPATSCSLHGRLGLAKRCAAFDVNLGCSGYIYGLWLASHLVACGSARRLLLLAGDTISRVVSPLDRSVSMLFGDAGTATAMERDENASPMIFDMGTDGQGQDHIIVPAGLFRHRHTDLTAQRTTRGDGNIRSDEDLSMNGAEVFSFTLREVPALLNRVLEAAGWTVETADAFVMHQANRFMLRHLAKRMRLPAEKMILAISDYGNTSSASVPLALTTSLSQRLQAKETRLILAGFGVGLSWGATALSCGPAMVMPELLYVPEPR